MIRLLLVDDQKTIRESLRYLLKSTPDIQVVGTANNGHMALEQVEILNPDVVLIDMEMPGLDGLSATRFIRERFPATKVLVLSVHDSDEYISQALQAGAMGYLLKITPAKELQESIRFVHLGYAQFGPGVVEKVMPMQVPVAPPPARPTDSATSAATGSTAGGYAHPAQGDPLGMGAGMGMNGDGKPADKSQDSSRFQFPGLIEDWLLRSEPMTLSAQLHPDVDAPSPRLPYNGALSNGTPSHPLPVAPTSPLVPPKFPWWPLVLGGLLLGGIWGGGLAYLTFTKPTYTSSWVVALPDASSTTDVTVPDVGAARSEKNSPYESQVSDPRENYRFLITTDGVMAQAADQLNMPQKEFGKPIPKLLVNTTLLQFSIDGASPVEAQQKAIALQTALTEKIQQLQTSEVNQQDRSLQQAYAEARQKLDLAQKRLAEFKARSSLGSTAQLQDLNANIEALRRQESETQAKLAEITANLSQLSQELELLPQEAIAAVTLKSDPLFQTYQRIYNENNAALISLTAQFSDSHPLVQEKREIFQQSQARVLQQAQNLLGRPVSLAELSQLSLDTGNTPSDRAALFQQLIQLQNQERGLNAQAQGLRTQIQQLEARMANLTQKGAQLTSLERDVQRAEAVYTSTATRLDLSNANSSGSYPPMTMVTPPNLPEEPSSPKTMLTKAGMALSSVLILMGMLLFLLRYLRQRRHSWSLGNYPTQMPGKGN
jgi:DNA-binding NarL/FixJ family response regulator/uncharacterized protein involved in exopolysaccharide biosynthesis